MHAVRVAFTAAVGSHLQTANHIESAMRDEAKGLACTVIDLVGFSTWDAKDIPYQGDSERVVFSREECGLEDTWVNTLTWPAVLDGAARLMRQIRPDVLVTMDDSWYDQRALILAARKAGVPVVLVQEGPFLDGIGARPRQRRRISLNPTTLKDSRLVRRLRRRPCSVSLPSYGKGGATVLLAASEWYKRRFVASGVPSHRVRVTGIPRYDSVPRIRRQRLERTRLGDSARVPTVLLLSQPFVRYNEMSREEYLELAAVTKAALRDVKGRHGATIEVRLHPSDRIEDLDALVGSELEAMLVTPSEPLIGTLASYDVVMGFTSSGLLEAMAVGVPVVVIETPALAFRTQFFRDLGVPVATDATAAAQGIAEALSSRTSRDIPSRLTNETGVLDGMASRRVATQCLEQIACRHSS